MLILGCVFPAGNNEPRAGCGATCGRSAAATASNSVARGLAPGGGVPAGRGAAEGTQWHGLDSTGPTPAPSPIGSLAGLVAVDLRRRLRCPRARRARRAPPEPPPRAPAAHGGAGT